jgi:hypothetical protein
LYLSADDYAVFEKAVSKVSAIKGRRVSREKMVMELCRHFIGCGAAPSKVRYQVVVHQSQDGSWYDTERGLLPVSEPAQQIVSGRPPAAPTNGQLLLEKLHPASKTADIPSSGSSTGNVAKPGLTMSTSPLPATTPKKGVRPKARRSIPTATLRALYQRAQGCCEGCGERCGLQVHHIIPVSEGGDHSLGNLRLFCRSCHDTTHHDDFEQKPGWQEARQARRTRPESDP